ncbi:hypothetical protein IEQ34_018911 [Dendrobium chrysotoxum]|uniref:Uncharacterized protein n=1 Tax=Dendrobium chrysotoxum TaxID=161865 RepID=A0AAV7G753_DENCH|nr:hypothetical protein IEQ34_018911 [Dendrobium chrysotoxum]
MLKFGSVVLCRQRLCATMSIFRRFDGIDDGAAVILYLMRQRVQFLSLSPSSPKSSRRKCFFLIEDPNIWYQRMNDITEVMKTPQNVLEAHGITTADIEGILEELQEHVESIDMSHDLHSIGGLLPLLGYLRNYNAGI